MSSAVCPTAADTLTIRNVQRLGVGDVAWTLIERRPPSFTHAAADDAAHWAWWQIAIERVAGPGRDRRVMAQRRRQFLCQFVMVVIR
jgi:hypothetical protein